MKKVLIVTSSPFNNTKLGKMCSQLMCYFRSKGLMVAAAAWDHDTSWYAEDEEGVCWYEFQNQKVGPVYTVFNKGEGASTKLYEVIKKLEIDTVLSIGDFDEIEYIYAVKSLEKKNIEWINILNNGSVPINDNREELFNSIDYHIILNKETEKEFKRLEIDEDKYTLQRWGSIFSNQPSKPKSDKFGVVCVAKNCNQSNLGCFIKAVHGLKHCMSKDKMDNMKFYLHTDLYDNGDYDVELLLKRYKVDDIIELPEEFIGVNDGISSSKFAEKLKKYDVIVDCSCQSATGISVLDGMALGLVPVVSRVGILKELAKELRGDPGVNIDCDIKGTPFIASDEKEFFIANATDLLDTLSQAYELWLKNGLSSISLKAQKISDSYNLETFLENTYKIIKDFQLDTNKLVVETF